MKTFVIRRVGRSFLAVAIVIVAVTSLLLLCSLLKLATISETVCYPQSILAAQSLQQMTLSMPLSASKPFYNAWHLQDCNELTKAWQRGESQVVPSASTENEYSLWQAFGNCSQVRNRFFYPEKPNSEAEANFPLAYSIVVYRDLQHIELLLSAIYAPQNTYCFHIDLKATQVFSHGLRRLASCFPNVIIADDQYSVSSLGMNMMRAYRSCFVALTAGVENSRWKYVFTLQGHDFPLRTNKELVEIAHILDGANDVELLPVKEDRWQRRYELKYSDDGVELDIDVHKEVPRRSEPIEELSLFKGSVSATLSRSFVEFVLSSDKATKLLSWLDYSVLADELYFATLSHSDENLLAPGGYPGRCFAIGRKDWLTRFTAWQDYANTVCMGKWRHSVCIFDVGDLPRLLKRPELFLNKFLTQSNPLPTYCMHEFLFNRTHFPEAYPADQFGFNRTWYESSAPVTFQKWRKSHPGASTKNFECVPCSYNCLH